jgi:hypothetical protein
MGRVPGSSTSHLQRWVLAAAAGFLATTGCSAAEPERIATPEQQDGPASSPTQVAPPTASRDDRPLKPPERGACYRLSADQVQQPTNFSDPVPCARAHTAQTYHVGEMPRSVVNDADAVDTTAIADYVTPRCDNRFVTHVRGRPNVRILSRLQAVWFVPTRSQLDRGARWFRCDVVGVAAVDELARLPASTAGVLDQPNSLDTYGLCSTAAPSRPGDNQVICGRAHSWRAFTIIRLRTDGSRWPSSTRLATARQECKARARAHQGFPLRWTYGWQRPTRAQWREGRHWGYCWVPER